MMGKGAGFYDKDKDAFAFSAPSGRARTGLPALMNCQRS